MLSQKKNIATCFILLSLNCTPTLSWAEDVEQVEQRPAQETYFSRTEIQIHADFDRKPAEEDIWTGTIEHFSTWKYGDNFFFVDIEGKPDFSTSADSIYLEYAPRLSMDKVFETTILPSTFLGDLNLIGQYNGSDQSYINDAWLFGVSIDFEGQPNFGYSHIDIMVRDEDTQNSSWQVSFIWGQPFSIGPLNLDFKGFADYWHDDNGEIFISEPQLRLNLDSFFGKDHLLSKTCIGTEVEITHDFFGAGYGWETNPTLFFAFPL